MPLAGHDKNIMIVEGSTEISTPMPLAGHDHYTIFDNPFLPNFYSHAPRGA